MAKWLSNLIGTKLDNFWIKRAKFDSSGLTADRTLTLPDVTGKLVTSEVVANVFWKEPVNDTISITPKAAFPSTIDQIRGLATSAGTVTLAIKINGTNVTSLSALAVTTTPQDVTATAAFTVAAGDEITFVTTSVSADCAGLKFTLKGTRTQ